MNTIILYKEDINNPLHPFMWQEICEQLDVNPDSDSLEITVASAKGDAE